MVRTRIERGIVVIDVEGALTKDENISELKEEIKKAIENNGQKPKLLINLSEVQNMDSVGLGVLVGVYTNIQKMQGKLGVLGLGESAGSLITFCKLMTIFQTYKNEEEAIEAIGKLE